MMATDHKKTIRDYWDHFLDQTGKAPGLSCCFCGYLGGDEKVANELVSLILAGIKTATTSCFLSYHASKEPLPKAGDFSIITDWAGNPKCVIETTHVTILPFGEVNDDICQREGEDGGLAAWHATHFDLFSQEGKRANYVFAWDTPVVIEEFRVIYP